MKDKFLLVDLETVIHGSYRWVVLSIQTFLYSCMHTWEWCNQPSLYCSLTWTDAHLHRQLITVLCGPVVESFDREFRILFAASFPVPETWRAAGTPDEVTYQLKNFSNLRFQKHFPVDTELTSPPSPPADTLLDWEAMGVIQRDLSLPDSPLDRHEEIMPKERPLRNNKLLDKNIPAADVFAYNENRFVDTKRYMDHLDFTSLRHHKGIHMYTVWRLL